MMITGMNSLGEWQSKTQSYHFSRYGGIWGWATWRRAWSLNDTTGEAWHNPKLRAVFRSVLVSNEIYMRLKRRIEASHSGTLETWDFIWLYSRLAHGGLAVVPSVNLVGNLGFREDATHTIGGESPLPAAGALVAPLRDPSAVIVDESYDHALLEKRGWLAHEQTGISALLNSRIVAPVKKVIGSRVGRICKARPFLGDRQ
jgi:hypothetical protein